ncbi:MAG: ABC transporter ATP-binding protein [Burkholderiaceae bacterium]
MLAAPSPILTLRDLTVRYPRATAPVLSGLNLTLAAGEIGALVGQSGCGKTTLLRAVAGFVPVSAGEIVIDGVSVSGHGFTAAPEKRGVGLVFQDYALFPHLSVAANVAFGLRAMSAATRSARAAEMLELVGLSGHRAKFPHELSGGQQQRVALARALAPRPALLLMDEPFSSLDVELRGRLSTEVRHILKASGTSAILVTHDQQEAFAMADRVGVMRAGQLEQWDRPYELYHRPATRYVANFIGQGVFLPAHVVDAQHVQTELGALAGDIPSACARGCTECGQGSPLDVLIRPDDVIHDDASALQAEVVSKAFRGADFLYTLRLASGHEVLALVPSHHDHAIGEAIGIRLDADHVITFAPTSVAPV